MLKLETEVSHYIKGSTCSIACFVAVVGGVCHNIAISVFFVAWRSPAIVKVLGTEKVVEGATSCNALNSLYAEGVGKVEVRDEVTLQHHAHVVVAILLFAHIIVETSVRQTLFAYILTGNGCTETAVIKGKDVVENKVGRERQRCVA